MHHTFPNGAVQGGALSQPGELTTALKRLNPSLMTREEREADLRAAYAEMGLDPDNLPRSMTG